MKTPSDISQDHAQLLMSQLLDGELNSSDAATLDSFLKQNPEAQNWMENLEILRSTQNPAIASAERSASISSIQKAIAADGPASPEKGSSLISFSALIRPMAAAAAIAIVGAASWLGLRPDASVEFEPNTVEFVATDIPGASTYIYPDEETGWTVVWVDVEDVDSNKG